MQTFTRYEYELILAYKGQLHVLQNLDYLTDEQRARNINELTLALIADMKDAEL